MSVKFTSGSILTSRRFIFSKASLPSSARVKGGQTSGSLGGAGGHILGSRSSPKVHEVGSRVGSSKVDKQDDPTINLQNTDTEKVALFGGEEFEVVDECIDDDETASFKESSKVTAAKSIEAPKSTDNAPMQSTEESKTKTAEELKSADSLETKEPSKTSDPLQQKKLLTEKRLLLTQQNARLRKPIDFTADISMDQLDVSGEYMTDEEIMNHLDEIENIVLDGTEFELQDDVDSTNAASNISEVNVQKNKATEDPSKQPENKQSEEMKTTSKKEDKTEEPSEVTAEKMEEKPQAVESESKDSGVDWYEKKLETKVATVKDRLSKLARVLEFSYPRYKGYLDRNEAITGTPVCRLDQPRRCLLEKPHINRWKFVCNRKPVQESTEKQNTNKEETHSGNSGSTMWRLTPTGVWDSDTDNSSQYPPFVMKAVKVFEDFLQTTQSVDEQASQTSSEIAVVTNEESKSEDTSTRSDTDEKETVKQEWLWLLVRCNRVDELMLFATGRNIDRSTMDELKQVYEVGPGKDCKVKSLYCKSVTKTGGTTNTTTTFLLGSEALDEVVGGIKIQLAPKTNFWSNAAGAESLGNAVADLLAPTSRTTVVEIGCGTGLIGLMLASKCHQVIGLDSPSEVEEAEMSSELNGVKNASFVMGEPAEVMATIAKVLSNCKAAAIVNTNTNIGRAIEVMTDLRKILSLKRLVMVTTLTKQSVRSILELTRPGNGNLGNPFIPIRACVVDTLPVGPHFEVVILMERRLINKFPRIWVNPATSASLSQEKSIADKGAKTLTTQGANSPAKKAKVPLNKVAKIVEPPVKKYVDKVELLPKKAKFTPGFTKKSQFMPPKQLKETPLPPVKNKFKPKRVHSPERPHVPPKKFAPRFEKGNFKPWAVGRVSPDYRVHEDRRIMNKYEDPARRNFPYRNRSPMMKKEQKSRGWSVESVVPRGSPGREKRFRDHKDQSDLRERLSSNRIEPEIMEKVKKQQQMLDMAKQKLSGPASTVDVATAKQLQNMLNMVLEQTNKLQSQLPRSVWDRIAPPENVPSSSNVQVQNDPLLKGRYVQEMGTQDILITTANREFTKPDDSMSRGNYDRFNNVAPSRNAIMASGSQQDSGGNRFQNTAPDRYHGRDGNFKQQEQGGHWKQMEKNRWEPFQPMKKNSPPIRKHISPPRHQISVMGRPISPRRIASPIRRPLSPPRRQITPQRRHMSPIRRQLSPPRRQMSSPRRQISPPRRQISPRLQISESRRQISPSRRAISPPRRVLSPTRRHISPTRRQVSPQRRMDDDWDIPSRGAVEQNTWQRPAERLPEKRWHDERQQPVTSNWEHPSGNDRYRKSLNQDKWEMKDGGHDASWNSSGGNGDTWANKQSAAVLNKDFKEHWQPATENRWQNSSGGVNGDNWNIKGKESFPRPLPREECKPVWGDGGKPRWGDQIGSTKDSWGGQADKEDWNDLPDDAKDPWGDDGNNISKDRWPKYENNPGPSSGWSRENQTGDTWGKPGDAWQNKSGPGNKSQWNSSQGGPAMNDSRWIPNDSTKKASGTWQGNSGLNNSWQPQNYPGFQQSRSYNPGSFKDRR
nr:uncharacterized protein LOC124217311 [Neodiprion pinetum]